MARVTVEDCLEKVPNRFALVLLAAERAKQLMNGKQPTIDQEQAAKNKEVVTALREIAAGNVRLDEEKMGAQHSTVLPSLHSSSS